MQLLGLAAIVLLLPVAVWGWRLLTHRPLDREWLRLSFWLAGTLLAAGFRLALPRSGAWPLPTGLGGVVGDAMLRAAGAGVRRAAVRAPRCSSIAIVLGVARARRARRRRRLRLAAIQRRQARRALDDEDDEPTTPMTTSERASISLGWLVHALLSLKARIVRLLRGAPRAPLPRAGRRAPAPHGAARRPARAASARQHVGRRRTTRSKTTRTKPRPRRAARKPRRAQPAAPLERRLRVALARSAGRAARLRAHHAVEPRSIEDNATALESVLGDFGVRGEIINARPGPVVTLYELEPAPGIKSSRVIGLADDIARSMSAVSARVAVVSGPQRHRHRTAQPEAREGLLARAARRRATTPRPPAKLPLCLGKTIGGEPVIVDLARMPHLLIAGTTGSGKSVAINTMILSLVYRLQAGPVPADHGRSEDARALRL